eukprot:PhM_4_TR1255/c1_g1_i1/m.81248
MHRARRRERDANRAMSGSINMSEGEAHPAPGSRSASPQPSVASSSQTTSKANNTIQPTPPPNADPSSSSSPSTGGVPSNQSQATLQSNPSSGGLGTSSGTSLELQQQPSPPSVTTVSPGGGRPRRVGFDTQQTLTPASINLDGSLSMTTDRPLTTLIQHNESLNSSGSIISSQNQQNGGGGGTEQNNATMPAPTAPVMTQQKDNGGSSNSKSKGLNFLEKSMLLATTVLASSPNNTNENERRLRMRQVMSKYKGVIPPDGLLMRYWYWIMVACAGFSFVFFTAVVVWDPAPQWYWVSIQLICTLFYLLDWFIHRKIVSIKYKLLWFDLIVGMPWVTMSVVELLMAAGDRESDSSHPAIYAAHIFCAAIPALKLARISSMFQMSMPDVIDTHYVVFYY